MAPRISLPGLGLPPIPNDIVHFDVEVADDPCFRASGNIESALTDLAVDGIDLPLSRILAYSGLHFASAVDDFWGIGEERARIAMVWTLLSMWHPRAETRRRDMQPKLVLDRRPNPRIQSLVSEVLAVGVGIHIAKRLYGVPFRFWNPAGLSRYDFWTPSSGGGKTTLEVRGRFDRKGVQSAIDGIHRKFTAIRDYRSALGVVFAPRTTPNTRAADIILADPDGDDPRPEGMQAWRTILKHYYFLFRLQGFTEFTNRLRELAQAEPRELENYVKKGDAVLKNSVHYRTSFEIEKRKFVGSAFEGIMWPGALTGIKENAEAGAFFWGLHDDIVRALQEGRLDDIVAMKIEEQSGRLGDYTQVLLEDGTALSWAPNISTLLSHP